MLDLRFIRENPDRVRQSLVNRGDNAQLDEILELDKRHRQLLNQAETLRAERNQSSKQLSSVEEKSTQVIARMRQLGEQITSLEAEIGQAKSQLDDLLLRLPNIPATDVPIGKDERDNTGHD